MTQGGGVEQRVHRGMIVVAPVVTTLDAVTLINGILLTCRLISP
jgi:hypothetical protein